jgi:Domain of unknown function (DUF4190)
MTYSTPPGGGEHQPPPPDPMQGYQPPPDPVPGYQPPAYQPDHSQLPYAGPPASPSPYGHPPDQAFSQPYPYDPQYGMPYAHPGYQPPRPTDGFAIASLIVSCVAVTGLCAWGIGGLLGTLGAIFGHMSRRRIRETGANGGGMALAGMIIGWSAAAISLIIITIIVALIVLSENSRSTY